MPKYKCKKCDEEKSSLDFIRSRAIWFNNGISDICESCLSGMIDSRDLNSVDKILQYLDIPLIPNEWIDLYEVNGDKTLEIYTTKFFAQKSNRNVDWSEVNNSWRAKQENNTLNKEINIMNEDWLHKMRDAWGDNYDMREYEAMEALYDNIQKTQNVITGIQEDQARNLCRLSIIIRNKIQNGEDASKEMKTYNDLVKAAGFEPKNARSYGDFESIGELINYLVRKGYRPNFYDGKDRDMVDLTIKNQQAYLRRLVINEPNLPDLVQQRRDSYKLARQLDDDMDDEDLNKYETDGMAATLEDSDAFVEDGIPICKGFILTEDYIEENRQVIEQWIDTFVAYPDLLIDIITPSESTFKLFFYQRIFLRACMRFRYVFGTYTRAFSKSFLAILSRVIRCALLANEKSFICADIKSTGVKIATEKITEIFRLFPLLEKEILVKHQSTDYIELIFRNGSMFDVIGTSQGTRGELKNSLAEIV